MAQGDEEAVSLSPGYGFHLQPDGQWDIKPIPPDVLSKATFSGYLTINGYKSTVFDMPNGDSWAQKSVNTPVASVSPMAKRIAARWLQAQKDVVTQLKDGLDNDEMAAWSRAAQEYADDVRGYLPDLDKAHSSAVAELEKIVQKAPKSKHPRVDGYEAQQLQEIFQQYLEDLRAAKQKFDEAVFQKLQELLGPGGEQSEESAAQAD